MIGRPGQDPDHKVWLTQPEALRHFHISRMTLYRWRQTHIIREARLTHGYPRMYNLADLNEADAKQTRRNPVMHNP